MDGETYEQWVAGIDVDTGRKKGRVRDDADALRFVEVTVNGWNRPLASGSVGQRGRCCLAREGLKDVGHVGGRPVLLDVELLGDRVGAVP
jgi:hypothetical protein